MARMCCADVISTKAKDAEFKFYAPLAKKVSIGGTFNNWDTRKNTAKKDAQGNWMVKLSLKPGKYEYKFFVDGIWASDPKCNSCITNTFGTQNCVVEVR